MARKKAKRAKNAECRRGGTPPDPPCADVPSKPQPSRPDPPARRGILARKISPLIDDRLEDRDYELLVEELVREFEPRTMTEVNAVEMLAFDYVQLARASQLNNLPTTDCHTYFGILHSSAWVYRSSVPDLEENVSFMDAVLRRVERRDATPYATDDLDWLVRVVSNRIAAMYGNAESFLAQAQSGTVLLQYEQDELDLFHDFAAVSPDEWDDNTVRSAITSLPAADADRRQLWCRVFRLVRSMFEGNIRMALENEKGFQRFYRTKLEETVRRPKTLECMERYDATIRQSIERGIAFLEERRLRRAQGLD